MISSFRILSVWFRVDEAGFQPFGVFDVLVPGALPQAGMGWAVGHNLVTTQSSNLALDFPFPQPEISPMVLPYKVATLLYCFNERDDVLLLERSQEPNRGFWSPCGGKLKMEIGESPYVCACREAQEEICVTLSPLDLHLAGMVSEHGYQGQTHWLMFLFEVKKKLTALPNECHEGRFQFFPRTEIDSIKIPQTDREQIWPWFWKYRGGFFAAHCHCHPDGRNDWTLEEAQILD